MTGCHSLARTQTGIYSDRFCGNGFTLGTLSASGAGSVLCRKNPWFDLFRVDRRPFHGGLGRYVKENLDYPYYLVRDRFAHADTDTLDDVHKGEGKCAPAWAEMCGVSR